MKKSDIANSLGVTNDKISWWADRFTDWLDTDSRWIEKEHDESDVQIFTLICDFDRQVVEDLPPAERISKIEYGLHSSSPAFAIKQRREKEKVQPDVARWEVISTLGVILKREFEWLIPLQPVNKILTVGCLSSEPSTCCAEPYALMWTLKAEQCTVIDINPEYIIHAQKWFQNTCSIHPYFKDYSLRFVVGDITRERLDQVNEAGFDLSFCQSVLYNLPGKNKITKAIVGMKNLVKSGGWIVAVEPQLGVRSEKEPVSEPIDISEIFDEVGLERHNLTGVPKWTYCYRKPIN